MSAPTTTISTASTAVSAIYRVASEFQSGINTANLCFHDEYEFFYGYGGVELIENGSKRGIILGQNYRVDQAYPQVQHIELPEPYQVGNIAPNMPTQPPYNFPPLNYKGTVCAIPCIGTIRGKDGETLYISHTDCNGFVGYVVSQASPEAYREVPVEHIQKNNDNQPWRSAINWCNFFNQQSATKYWRTIVNSQSALDELAEILPGDIMAWHDQTGGHVMVVASVARKYSNASELSAIVSAEELPNLTSFPYYAIEVIDSTNVPRYHDSQVEANKQNGGHLGVVIDTIPAETDHEATKLRSGIGRGTLLIGLEGQVRYCRTPHYVTKSAVAPTPNKIELFSIGVGRYLPQ